MPRAPRESGVRRRSPISITLIARQPRASARPGPFRRARSVAGGRAGGAGWRQAVSPNAYAAAGADLVFPTSVSPAQLAEIRRSVAKPAMIVDMPGATLADEERAGASIVLYYGFSALVAFDALGRALAAFKATRDANAVPGYREHVREFEDFMGYREFAERARRYGAS